MMPVGTQSIVQNDHGIISNPPVDYTPDPRGLGCAIFDRMVANKEFIAQIDGITGEKDTFESLLQRCIRTAISMRSRGITSEDIVTICSYNHLNSCVPYLASLFLGVKVACLDPTLCLLDTVSLLKLVRPKIAFVGAEAVTLMEDALAKAEIDIEIIVFGKSTTHGQFSEFLIPSPEEESFAPVNATAVTDTVIILFSGGTTGLPKPVCLSHKSLLCQTYELRYCKIPGSRPANSFIRQMTFCTFYWISSVSILLISIFYRRTRVLYPKFDIDSFWTLMENAKVNVFLLSPSQAQRICNRGKPSGVNTSNLKQIIITGSPLSKQLLQEIKEILPGVDIRNLYAIAEAGGYTTAFRPHASPEDARLLSEKPDSCGRPRPGISCKVVDNETGEILGPHQKGELRIKTDFQMNGFYNMNSSTSWDSEGWLKTGDVTYYDEDNCFYVVDRIKEMLKYKSYYVAPAKLEAVLHSHPAVETAVVVGLPNPEDGDHPVGVVVLRRSAVGSVTADDIEHYVEQIVDDKYRLRGGVRIVEHIPITPVGKPRRRDVKELILQREI